MSFLRHVRRNGTALDDAGRATRRMAADVKLSRPSGTSPRTWFRFRLSTLLVLMGVVAWTMSIMPIARVQEYVQVIPPGESMPRMGLVRSESAWAMPISIRWGRRNFRGNVMRGAVRCPAYVFHEAMCNRAALGPLSVLAIFLAWKIGWAVIARKTRRQLAQSAPALPA